MKTISVKGTGEVSAVPDTARLTLTLTAENENCKECSAMAAAMTEELTAAAGKLGFGEKELRTGRYDLSVKYNDSHTPDGRYVREFAGFCCTQELHVEFPLDMERVTEVITAFAACKAQPQLHISFSIADSEPLRQEALAAAADNARLTAQTLCRASGVKLGGLVRIASGTESMNIISPTDMNLPYAAPALRLAKAALPMPEDISIRENAVFEWEIE